jgi:DtxR family Mn-dependent transcriptional regulator
LRYLAQLELVPGAEVELLERAPFNGPLKFQVGGREHFLGAELARSLEVEETDPSPKPKKIKTKGAGGGRHVS